MAINWRQRSTVFQLLAAVYAELGDEAFKGRYGSIAKYFGANASYDAIKSFFAKEVAKAAEDLRNRCPNHHGSGRPIQRSSAGPSRRPPHLYFDDEDISVLTQREVEVVQARLGHALRAPAKYLRVIKASPRPSTDVEETQPIVTRADSTSADATSAVDSTTNVVSDNTSNVSQPRETASQPAYEPGPNGQAPITTAQSNQTVETSSYHTAPEIRSPSRKRPFSEVAESIESDTARDLRASTTGHTSELFGYVTNLGQFRCALCLNQLPSQEELNQHERISELHLRNLQDQGKLDRGRQKLAQVTAVPEVGRHHNTPIPLQRASVLPRFQAINQIPLPLCENTLPDTSGQSSIAIAPRDKSVEGRPHSASCAPSIHRAETPKRTPQLASQDKGKGRAVSLASSLSYPPPSPDIRTPFQAPPTPYSRPTTARTEIGTLNTPQQPNVFRDQQQHQQHHHTSVIPTQVQTDLQTKLKSSTPSFSTTEMAEIMRSTELIVQLMGCVQREAKAVAQKSAAASTSGSQINGDAGGSSFELGYVSGSGSKNDVANADLDTGSTSSIARSTTLAATATSNGVPRAMTAPGIEVYSGVKRQRLEKLDKGKQKDTGEPVSFILLE